MVDSGSNAPDAVEADLVALEKMRLLELRTFWSARWGFAPRLRSATFLRHMIAWRLQSAVEGGIDPETRRLLRLKSLPRAPAPPVGARLTREYRGKAHQVEVVTSGFAYAGRTYGSLSEVARLITGTRWNGPRFFGLREERGND